MIRHMLFFSFRADVPEHAREAMLKGLAAFPARFPAMKRLQIGKNISWRDQSFSHGFTVEFDTVEELDAYLKSDFHEDFVTTLFKPLVEKRAIVTMDCGEENRNGQ